MSDPRYAIGVDIGGTFTDLVVLGEDGAIGTRKVPSTPDDYSHGIVRGLGELLAEVSADPSAVDEVVHGTTVATNTILEQKGARTALITTHGFRDVLELQRVRVPELYNLFYEKPPPLVPRRARFEVDERIGPRGEVWRELDPESLARAIAAIKRLGAEAIAVCLLHSYINDAHERRVAEILRTELPGAYVTSSAELLREIREYERTSTTVLNAYLGPVVRRYVRSLILRLREIGIAGPLLVVQSNGGVMPADLALERPAALVESGPAAGVAAAASLARTAGYPNLITLDVGGTTAKASLIEGFRITQTSEYEVGGGINASRMLVNGGGYALKIPAVDVAEIGAGGGSIVSIDNGGRLKIGPRSAGAAPGPVCYNAGGEEPTVTDSSAVLGYLNPDYLTGGNLPLDTTKAAAVLGQCIAEPLGLTVLEAAHGVYQLASASMVRAVKAVSTHRGRDPRDCVLLAFGGNGPVFATEMARALGVRTVVVPEAAGLFSATGLLSSDIEHQIVQTYMRTASPEAFASEVIPAFTKLEAKVVETLERQGYDAASVRVQRAADLRYAEQGYELTIPVPDGRLDPEHVACLIEAFSAEHLKSYGHRADDEDIDFVNLRVAGRIERARRGRTQRAVASGDGHARTAERQAFFGPGYGLCNCPVLPRVALASDPVEGPVIIEEYDATTVVPPDWRARLDEWGNIVAEV